jgi:hypothetical protein
MHRLYLFTSLIVASLFSTGQYLGYTPFGATTERQVPGQPGYGGHYGGGSFHK